MRFGHVVLAYFLIGSMMWAGGVLDWDEAGVGSMIVQPSGDSVKTNDSTASEISEMGGPFEEAASNVSGGGLLAVWNILVMIIGYLFWPVTALQAVEAPSEIVVVVGGSFVMAFIMSLIKFIRSGA